MGVFFSVLGVCPGAGASMLLVVDAVFSAAGCSTMAAFSTGLVLVLLMSAVDVCFFSVVALPFLSSLGLIWLQHLEQQSPVALLPCCINIDTNC